MSCHVRFTFFLLLSSFLLYLARSEDSVRGKRESRTRRLLAVCSHLRGESLLPREGPSRRDLKRWSRKGTRSPTRACDLTPPDGDETAEGRRHRQTALYGFPPRFPFSFPFLFFHSALTRAVVCFRTSCGYTGGVALVLCRARRQQSTVFCTLLI